MFRYNLLSPIKLKNLILGGGGGGWERVGGVTSGVGRFHIPFRTEDFSRNRLRNFANCHKAESKVEITFEISLEVSLSVLIS